MHVHDCLWSLCTGEEKFNKSLDEVKALEDEKRESSTEELRTKNSELQANVDKLKAVSLNHILIYFVLF